MSWVEKNRKINNPGEGKIIRDSRVRHFNASKTPYRDRIDLIQTLKGRCMVNTVDSKVRFYVYFLTHKKFLPLRRKHSATAFFNHIDLIVACLLNKNKSKLLATFENWCCKVAKQLLNFLVISKLEPLETYLLIKSMCYLAFKKGISYLCDTR